MPEWLLQFIVPMLGAAAAYGAIKSDLRAAHEKSDAARDTAAKAHARLDDHINMHHVKA